jgi:hypothetical protein
MGLTFTHSEYCEIHAPKGYISLITTNCEGCKLLDIVDKDGYCITCHPSTIARYARAKQQKVVDWLKTSKQSDDFTSIDTVLPESMVCNSTKYRPDIVYQLFDGYTVIVEIDELQHNSNTYKSCDIPRMINIHNDLRQPTYFIRYNPDHYTINGNKKITSDGVRKKTLIKWITLVKNYAKDGKVTNGLHVLYLFYNEYD